MRSFIALALTALAAAAPVEEVRQENLVFNDLINADCRDVVFIFARGSGEDGNMVSHTCIHRTFKSDAL